MKRAIGLIVALLASGSVVADDGKYWIQCTILEGDRVVGSPAVVAKSGHEVKVSVTDTYDLSLTAEGRDGGRVGVSADIAINGESHSPTMLVQLDRPAEIKIGDITLTITVSKFVPDDRATVGGDA